MYASPKRRNQEIKGDRERAYILSISAEKRTVPGVTNRWVGGSWGVA